MKRARAGASNPPRTILDGVIIPERMDSRRFALGADLGYTSLARTDPPEELREAAEANERRTDKEFESLHLERTARLISMREKLRSASEAFVRRMTPPQKRVSGHLHIALFLERDKVDGTPTVKCLETYLVKGVPTPPTVVPKSGVWKEADRSDDNAKKLKDFKRRLKKFNETKEKFFKNGPDWMEQCDKERLWLDFLRIKEQMKGVWQEIGLEEISKKQMKTIPAKAFGVKQGKTSFFEIDGVLFLVYLKMRMCIDYRAANLGIATEEAVGLLGLSHLIAIAARAASEVQAWPWTCDQRKIDLVADVETERKRRAEFKRVGNLMDETTRPRSTGPKHASQFGWAACDVGSYYYNFMVDDPGNNLFCIWDPTSDADDRCVTPKKGLVPANKEVTEENKTRHALLCGGAYPPTGRWRVFRSECCLFGALASVYGPWAVSESLQRALWRDGVLCIMYVDDNLHTNDLAPLDTGGPLHGLSRLECDHTFTVNSMRSLGLPIPEGKIQSHSANATQRLGEVIEALGFQVRVSLDPAVLRTLVEPSEERIRKTLLAYDDAILRLTTDPSFPSSDEDDKVLQKVVGKLGFLTSLKDPRAAKPVISRAYKVIGLGFHRGRQKETKALLSTLKDRTVGVPPVEIERTTSQERWTYYSDASLDEEGRTELGGILFPPSSETSTEDLRVASTDRERPQRRPLAFRIVLDKEEAGKLISAKLAGSEDIFLSKAEEMQFHASLRRSTHIGLFETIAVAGARLLEAEWKKRHLKQEPDPTREEQTLLLVDNLGAAFALVKATSDNRFFKALVEAECLLSRGRLRHYSYVFSERNIADTLTRRELLDSLIQQFNPDFIDIGLTDCLPPPAMFKESFFAPFERELEEYTLKRTEEEKHKRTEPVQEEKKKKRKK